MGGVTGGDGAQDKGSPFIAPIPAMWAASSPSSAPPPPSPASCRHPSQQEELEAMIPPRPVRSVQSRLLRAAVAAHSLSQPRPDEGDSQLQ